MHLSDVQGDRDRGGVDEAVSGTHVNAGKRNAKRLGDGARGDGKDVLPAFAAGLICKDASRMDRERRRVRWSRCRTVVSKLWKGPSTPLNGCGAREK